MSYRLNAAASHCTNLKVTSSSPLPFVIPKKCCGQLFTSVSDYRLSIDTSPFNDTVETLACGSSGRGVGKATVPLLCGSLEQPAVLRVSVVKDSVMMATAMEEGGAEDEEAQVVVRGVAGTSVKAPSSSSSFHAGTKLKSEQVFLFKRFDIPLQGDQLHHQQQRKGSSRQSPPDTMSNNSTRHYFTHPSPSSPSPSTRTPSDIGNNDQSTRFTHQLDPIVIDPSWPSSSVHPKSWVRYTVELMTNRKPQFKSVIEVWVYNNTTPLPLPLSPLNQGLPTPPPFDTLSSPSLLQESDSDIILNGSESTTVVTGSAQGDPGLFLLGQGHPWNIQLPEVTAVFEVGQTVPLRLLSTTEQAEHQIRLTLVQKRILRGKGIVGTAETVVQELVVVALFSPSSSPKRTEENEEKEEEVQDEGAQKEEGAVVVVQLNLPTTPVLAPSTRTMYLDIEHSLVASRVIPETKTRCIVSEVPIRIVAPRRRSSE
ncbi:MAG: hypothetical protein J3R72DRAFT_449561 [Linnemannia gamsii]|nr:MAG: hypothetical protein J3R72DRAFT_449561 [Linnemannia gamsii]